MKLARSALIRSLLAAALGLLPACAGPSMHLASAQQDEEPPITQRRGKAFEDTSVRLAFFAEDITIAELDHDLDNAPDFTALDSERERYGFRADFGSRAVGGYVQLFMEEFRTPALPGGEYDNIGVGGGLRGRPRVGQFGDVDLIVPFKFGIALAVGIEEVGGFDEEFIYFDTDLEAGFGARFRGLQPSIGVVGHNFWGLHESDNPANPSNLDPTTITGFNIGGYAELLYKHDKVPVFASVRALFGDVEGLWVNFGAAF